MTHRELTLTAGPRVLFVAGYGRSGSTLLDQLLGQVEGFASCGELRHIWARGYLGNELCGCGRPFDECPFWSAVTERAFGDAGRASFEEARRLQITLDHLWKIQAMRRAGRDRERASPGLAAYLAFVERLYRAIHEVTGGAVIVDSSKSATQAFLLRAVPGVEVRLVHLVRDSRAVAYSWTRTRVRPEVPGRPEPMPRYSPARSAAEWNALNAAAQAGRRIAAASIRIRYEDLVRDTPGMMRRVLDMAGASGHADELGFLERASGGEWLARLEPTHTVSGNVSRFANGTVALRLDREWEERLPAAQRALVTLLTWPWLARYGYPLGQRRDARSSRT